MIPSVSLFAVANNGGPPVVDLTTQGAAATGNFALYTVSKNGRVYYMEEDNATYSYAWLLSGAAADCQVRLVKNSGSATVSGSSLNTWLPLTSDVEWDVTAPPGYVKSANCTVSIRLAASPFTVLDSADISISSDNT